MELFITMEAQHDVSEPLRKILADIVCRLDFVTNKNAGLQDINNYGAEFRLISVIPTCLDNGFWNASGWKERKQIWRKKKEADIRLRMDYYKFINETSENQRLMFIGIIIKSIRTVQEKSIGDFQGEKLIEDILHALDVTNEQIDLIW